MRAEELRVLQALVFAVEDLAFGVRDMATFRHRGVDAALRQIEDIKHDIGNLIVDAEKGA